jgi:hypothetical protein
VGVIRNVRLTARGVGPGRPASNNRNNSNRGGVHERWAITGDPAVSAHSVGAHRSALRASRSRRASSRSAAARCRTPRDDRRVSIARVIAAAARLSLVVSGGHRIGDTSMNNFHSRLPPAYPGRLRLKDRPATGEIADDRPNRGCRVHSTRPYCFRSAQSRCSGRQESRK